MKIKNTGKTRIRVEGFGYVDPGKEIIVPEAAGRSLCRGKSSFREVIKSPEIIKKKEAEKKAPVRKSRRSGQTRRSAPTKIRNKGKP